MATTSCNSLVNCSLIFFSKAHALQASNWSIRHGSNVPDLSASEESIALIQISYSLTGLVELTHKMLRW